MYRICDGLFKRDAPSSDIQLKHTPLIVFTNSTEYSKEVCSLTLFTRMLKTLKLVSVVNEVKAFLSLDTDLNKGLRGGQNDFFSVSELFLWVCPLRPTSP